MQVSHGAPRVATNLHDYVEWLQIHHEMVIKKNDQMQGPGSRIIATLSEAIHLTLPYACDFQPVELDCTKAGPRSPRTRPRIDPGTSDQPPGRSSIRPGVAPLADVYQMLQVYLPIGSPEVAELQVDFALGWDLLLSTSPVLILGPCAHKWVVLQNPTVLIPACWSTSLQSVSSDLCN